MRNLSKDVAAKLNSLIEVAKPPASCHHCAFIATAMRMVLAAKTGAATAKMTARICHQKVNYVWGLGGRLFYTAMCLMH